MNRAAVRDDTRRAPQTACRLGQAYWLIDKIACAQIERRHAAQPFQLWKRIVNDDLSADPSCTDGNGAVVSTERTSGTDFPLPEIKLYPTDNTILLPSGY